MDLKHPAKTPFSPQLFAVLLIGLGCLPTCKMANEKKPTQSPPPGSVLITKVRILNTDPGTVSDPSDILIINGLIKALGEPGSIAPNGASKVISGEGLYAIPGLIDVHAHIGDGGLGSQTETDRRNAMAQFASYGVTTIFVPGGGGGNDHQLALWKKAADDMPWPGIYGSGAIITAPGSHPIGTLWNMSEDTDPAIIYERGAVELARPDQVAPLLDQKQSFGVDALKIVIEDGPEPWYPKPRFSNEMIAQIAKQAHQRDLRVYAHISTATHLKDGLEAGIDGVMHSAEDLVDDEIFQKMAARGIFYVPTLALYDGFFNQAMGQFEEEPFAIQGVSQRALDSLKDDAWRNQPPDPIDWVEPTKAALSSNLRRAHSAGVPLALGTDVNNPTVFPGYSAHEELALLVEAGLSPAQALHVATMGGAAFLKKENSLGKIAPGFEADLILLSENPLQDILNTRTIQAVFLNGRLVENIVSTTTGDLQSSE